MCLPSTDILQRHAAADGICRRNVTRRGNLNWRHVAVAVFRCLFWLRFRDSKRRIVAVKSTNSYSIKQFELVASFTVIRRLGIDCLFDLSRPRMFRVAFFEQLPRQEAERVSWNHFVFEGEFDVDAQLVIVDVFAEEPFDFRE